MGLFEHLPYVNFHELNLSWLLSKMRELETNAENIRDIVDEWLKAHPEVFPFVTPQMYGAVGDGLHDDTTAFQDALEAGVDIMVPTDAGQDYLITGTLIVKNNGLKRIYGTGEAWRGPSTDGAIHFHPASGSTQILFQLQDGHQGFGLFNLRLALGDGNGNNSGVALSSTGGAVDKDITIDRVQFVNATLAIDFVGRGLKCSNCEFNSGTMGVAINWPAGQTDSYGSRSIGFENCRFHSIVPTAIEVQSGHAYGLRVVNCWADHGIRCLVRAKTKAINWTIEGNAMQEATAAGSTNRYMIEFQDGARSCNVSGNNLRGSSLNLVRITGGDVQYCAFNNNVAEVANDLITFVGTNTVEYNAIVGNVAELASGYAVLRISNPNGVPTHFVVTGNVTNQKTRLGTAPTYSVVADNVDVDTT